MKESYTFSGGNRRPWQTRPEFPSSPAVTVDFPAIKRRAILKVSLRDKGMEA